jgi:hypothetical protein
VIFEAQEVGDFILLQAAFRYCAMNIKGRHKTSAGRIVKMGRELYNIFVVCVLGSVVRACFGLETEY